MTDNPFVKRETMRLVQPKVVDGKLSAVIVLERIVDGAVPDYCIHGRTKCFRCDTWCWLGDKSHDAVLSGAAPLCVECATTYIPAGTEPVANLGDHRRADGPHT